MLLVHEMENRSSDNIIYAEYLFNILVQSNLWTICTFSFRQKTAVLISSFSRSLAITMTKNVRCILTEWANLT